MAALPMQQRPRFQPDCAAECNGSCCCWWFCPCLQVGPIYEKMGRATDTMTLILILLSFFIAPLRIVMGIIVANAIRGHIIESMNVEFGEMDCSEICCAFCPFTFPCYMAKVERFVEENQHTRKDKVGAPIQVNVNMQPTYGAAPVYR